MTAARRRSPLRRLAEGLLVAAASTLATVALVELSLALFRPVPHSIERNMYFAADPHTGYRNRPDSLGFYQNAIPARANSRGHRDDETPLAKPEGVLRILVIGDSFTVGANVREEEAYPQVLEEILRRECGRHVEVINAGVGGWGPFQYAQYYEHYGVHFAPDVVLVGFFVGNDTFDDTRSTLHLPTAVQGRRVRAQAARSVTAEPRVWLAERFHLARLAFARSPAAFAVRRRHCNRTPKGHLDIQKERIEVHHASHHMQLRRRSANAVAQMARLKAIGGARTRHVVVLLPDENQINPELQRRIVVPARRKRFDFRMPQKFLVAELQRRGVDTIDILDDFLADRRCLYMNDTHWTPEGHRLAATAIARALAPELGTACR